jgi:lysophospholipase L1-like esterase
MRRAACAAAAALACAVALPGAASAASASWVTAWEGAAQAPGPLAPLIPFSAGTGGRTVRDVVRVEATGATLRIRLTNRFGTRPLAFGDVRVALAARGAAVRPGTTARVTFGGARSVRIPVGATATSDPVRRAVRFGRRLAISAYSAGATGAATTSGSLLHTNYVSGPGDHAAAASAAPFTTTVHNWFYAAGVDVRPAHPAGALVAFGASTTAGQGATPDAARDWPALLSARLRRPVLNAGVSGNALHASSPCYGQSGVLRFDRDVLAQHGVRAVLIDLGANDLLQPRQPHTGVTGACDVTSFATTARLLELDAQLVRRAHARGIKAYALTMTPFGGGAGATPDALAQRDAFNAALRAGRAHFDGILDVATAVADPADPSRLDPAFDSGDHLHFNDAGYAAIARSIHYPPEPLTTSER